MVSVQFILAIGEDQKGDQLDQAQAWYRQEADPLLNKRSKTSMSKYLVVGAGLFGAVFAREAAKRGHEVTVIEKRDHIAGNIYTKEIDGIQVHQYGAHIFHTSDKEVWEYVQQFAEFNRYTNSPVANYKGHMYNLPFNMNTFAQMWGIRTPQEALDKINEQRAEMAGKEPQNLEEQAISLIGRDIYEKLIKGYTEKQWGRKATELPAFIIKRVPVRLIYDNNYFNDDYQGIPKGGYTKLVENMLKSDRITVETNTNFFDNKDEYLKNFDKVVYTGPIDEFFDYQLGELEYRSLRFETEEVNVGNYQGNAVINYTDAETPYTRVIEHKHFEFGKGDPDKSVITREYPANWSKGDEPYYPVNNDKNNALYAQYKDLAAKEDAKVIFGGRLGQYKYYNMDQVIRAALDAVNTEFGE
ncbi:UDP-galactopyranose mutase [Lactobacillus delbrueckii subsp. lactis]|uniref:UDP-galactopyranose mutase n=2 Tax=Lactobacillus delbrueckii TaxID=1584 RepID=A0ABD4SKP9_LACDL|nr:UDP-galactopyranose mutase [Lactobacillus delbrueckii]APG70469.1 UDP-galactopyranose mutase [Lactobacillus delbrueckii subsp. lactis]MCD5442856.1 UDP-galactopyranose mutase [Lactobacillus delbrueckii subsp. lactis]MCD5444941.1 UDP-galactopyranose mutase [Lactobacillus delbrueckii subsp. lactis]MCD5489262.1 UDP-galactopyranose mutase [Lactobacillus delbrueckii subsp. lactis]MCD5509300.1 UDP-galactopyranose mutase [Lactobacillus delbrueckii subsp. lactis]